MTIVDRKEIENSFPPYKQLYEGNGCMCKNFWIILLRSIGYVQIVQEPKLQSI